ncbi:MAG: hypothetical protein OEM24_02265 [Paracoccaceae bacterium]|nr:hypothetical protein [Paracoccaceae bacterium]
MRRALLATALLLAACGPNRYDDCVARAQAELETVDRLIAETDANLLRGYALEPDTGQSGGFRLCAGGDSPLSVCAERTRPGDMKPVAINPISERLKLANLRQRRQGLQELADREVAQCETLYRRRL